MTAFNVVRFRVKPGYEQEFIDKHKQMGPEPPKGARRFSLVRTGDQTFCAIGEWDSFDNIVEARPIMIGMLDTFRGILEDLGGDLGVTDPASGDMVFEMAAPSAKPRASAGRKKARAAKPSKPAAKKAVKKKAAAKKPARKAKAAKRGRKR